MSQPFSWRPEHAILAVSLLIGIDLLAAVLFLLGVFGGTRWWYGLILLGGGALAAWVVLAYSRKLRRAQRPEWLETQAWQRGLLEKLRKPPGGTKESAESRKQEPR